MHGITATLGLASGAGGGHGYQAMNRSKESSSSYGTSLLYQSPKTTCSCLEAVKDDQAEASATVQQLLQRRLYRRKKVTFCCVWKGRVYAGKRMA
ncbi:hypothetical protein PIB30_061504 [Stylosanthes scabra]|uniref:Uncharacterized protein n=1 Tax=Stylosanthes scabra TaxID=79078 RepID=A0ABU6SLX9_9FABA|nr:hypothetical protein [Stylosanthes scabra]